MIIKTVIIVELLAGAVGEYSAQEAESRFDAVAVSERTDSSFVILRLMCEEYFGKIFLRKTNIEILLIIPHHYIESGTQLFYVLGFQYKRLDI